MTYPFRFSVDNHTLHVVATDGHDVEDMAVSGSVIINRGERFDLIVEATEGYEMDQYWIRVRTLEYYENNQVESNIS